MKEKIVLHGKVEHGKKLGRQMNIPTANIVPLEDVSDLEYGVYYSTTYINGKEYKSITNLGTKPTVKSGKEVNVESFIYDFEGDLYDEDIIVEFHEFRRPEMRFDNISELKKQMNEDLEAGLNYEKK